MNLVKCLKTPFSVEHLWWLLLVLKGFFLKSQDLCFNSFMTEVPNIKEAVHWFQNKSLVWSPYDRDLVMKELKSWQVSL